MASLEVDPADGTERPRAIGRRRTGVATPPSARRLRRPGATVVARAVRSRRRSRRPTPWRRLRLPNLPVPTPALARAK
jgi:hypothetical protein